MSNEVIAGTVASVIFAVANLPMLVKAVRTREMASYSLGYLLMANAGNCIYSIYVFSLPIGPIWVLHLFYLVSMAVMLVLFMLFRAPSRLAPDAPARPRHRATLKHARNGEHDRVGSASLRGR